MTPVAGLCILQRRVPGIPLPLLTSMNSRSSAHGATNQTQLFRSAAVSSRPGCRCLQSRTHRLSLTFTAYGCRAHTNCVSTLVPLGSSRVTRSEGPPDHSRRCSSSSSHLHPLSGLHQWEITTAHTYNDTQSKTAPALSLHPSRPACSGLPLAAGPGTCVCELYPSRLSWSRPQTGAGPGPAQAGTGRAGNVTICPCSCSAGRSGCQGPAG